MRHLSLIALIGAAALVTGCATYGEEYRPAGPNALENQPVTARYAIPPQNATGALYVTSLGVKALPTGGGTGQYLHVRLAVENDKDTQPWVLDARDQVASYAGGGTVSVAFADGSTGAGKPVAVAPAGRGFLDLFFSVPAQTNPQRVEIAWKVRRGADEMANRTAFELTGTSEAPVYAYRPYSDSRVYVGVGVGAGWWWGGPYWSGAWWGGPWWYDPFFYPAWYHYPRYGYGYGGYYGRGYYGGRPYYGHPNYYGGGGARGTWRSGGAPAYQGFGGGGSGMPGSGSWRGGGGGGSFHGGGAPSAPHGGGGGGGGWRSGGRAR